MMRLAGMFLSGTLILLLLVVVFGVILGLLST